MKLLFLAYYFPPVQTPGNVRRYHFYREARKYFEVIHVITTRNRRLMATDESLRVETPYLTEVPAWDLRRLTLGRERRSPTISSRRKNNALFRFFRRLTDSFPFNLLLDDGGPLYIWCAYRAGCRRVETEGITHVFSSFRPYADHLAAWLLKRRYPHLYWIADFRDLHVDPARRNVLWPAFQGGCNRWILRRADLVTTVSEGLQRQLQPLAKEVYVLRNGVGEEDLPKVPAPPFEKFTVAYTGSLYPGLQTAGVLWETLRKLTGDGTFTVDNFQLIYAGKDGVVWEGWMEAYGLAEYARNIGLVSRRKAMDLQRRADINLLLSWTFKERGGVLTCKLSEYLSAGNPILVIVNGGLDQELGSLFSKFNAGIIFYTEVNHANEIRDWVSEQFKLWQIGDSHSLPSNRREQPLLAWPRMMKDLVQEKLLKSD